MVGPLKVTLLKKQFGKQLAYVHMELVCSLWISCLLFHLFCNAHKTELAPLILYTLRKSSRTNYYSPKALFI